MLRSASLSIMALWLLPHALGFAQTTDPRQNEKASDNIVSIEMIPSNQTLYTSSKVQYRAVATYENTTTRDITDTAIWKVNNSGMSGTCASITATGLLTAGYCNGWGTTMSVSFGGITTTGFITSTYGNSPQVTVAPASSILSVGATQQFTATWDQLNNAGGPKDYTDKVTWTSSDSSVASISSKGLVTAKAPGKTVITAAHDASGFIHRQMVPNTNGPVLLTVAPCKIKKVSVILASVTILQGSASQFRATGTCDNGAMVDITNVVSWQTKASNISMINSTGLAAGWLLGETTGTASFNALTSSPVEINVVGPSSLASIAITPQKVSIGKDDLMQFKAVGTYQDGSSQEITDSVLWTSDTPDTVSINTSGLATGLALGNAEITAVIGDLAAPVAQVTVSDNILSIVVSPQNAQIKILGAQQFKATAVYQDGHSENITDTATWTTTDASVVSFTDNGLAYGGAEGLAAITASSGDISSESVPVTVISD